MPNNLISKKIEPSFFEKREDTIFTWLGLAGVLINAQGTIVFIDPLITYSIKDGRRIGEDGNILKIDLPIDVNDVSKADVVLYTHADSDHCTKQTAELLNKFKPKYLSPQPVKEILRKAGVTEDRMITAKDFVSFKFGNVEISVTPALHDWQSSNHWKRGDASGYLVKTPNGTIWHPGDTRLLDELLAVSGVDVLFFDIAAVNAHLGPEGSARIAETSGAKVLVAYHYGTYEAPPGTWANCDPKDALPYVKNLSARLLFLNPGEILSLPLNINSK